MRRRKPVVVVGVAAAGLLVAGGIVATRAGAQETPQWPDVPGFSLSDLPGFSGFGDDSGSAGAAPAADDSGAAGGATGGLAGGTADRAADGTGAGADGTVAGADGTVAGADGTVAGADGTGAGAAGGSAAGAAHGSDAGDFRGSGGAFQAGHAGAGQPGADDAGAGGSSRPDALSVHQAPVDRRLAVRGQAGSAGDDAADRSGADPVSAGTVHDVPAQPKAARGDLIAAAKQEVTASDVSSSPSAPVQQQILALINANRRAHGCGGVTLDRRLIEAANGHAADMARHDYFAHESRDGRGAGDRVTHAGYDWKHYGENIARGVDSPYEVVDGWMHSPEHRHNILDCTLDQMGVGLAISGDRTIYWVQDFATPM